MIEDPPDEVGLRELASRVLDVASRRLQPIWNVRFMNIAAGGPVSDDERNQLVATAQKPGGRLPAAKPLSVPAPDKLPSSFFRGIMRSYDATLPDGRPQRDVFTAPCEAYPDDPLKHHLFFLTHRRRSTG